MNILLHLINVENVIKCLASCLYLMKAVVLSPVVADLQY